jgi:Family of unknown function (DUF6600)
MHIRHWLRLLLAALVWAAFLAAPGLPLPAADRLGLGGSAAAQESIDIDTFYDELEPYGQWVWHPRFGYVWLPETVSDNWRPYTVGRWTYTDEYGWYWDSHEPFAWAVYHYGRWGYNPDYGWFWVPGDTWAPAWVQWRYSDNYVGWAPIGPGRPGYAYGVPVNYDPPIAESWVFVQPRYLTSRAVAHYAVPISGLGVAFFGATNIYRPQYRGGVVYNYGMPRDLVVKITRRPIYVQKIYRTNSWKGGRFDNNGPNRGIGIYAPRFSKDNRPNRGPKKFADNPNDFRPKAKLKDTFKGDVPKGWGPSAKGVKSIAKEDPDAFKRKHGFGGEQFGDRGKGKDHDRDKDKGQASKDFDRDGKQGKGDHGVPPPPPAPPPVVKGATGDATSGKTKDNKNNSFDVRTQTERGTLRQPDNNENTKNKNKNKDQNFGNQGGSNQVKRDDDEGGGNKNKNKNFGDQGSRGGSNQFKQGKRDDDQGGGGQDKNKKKNFGGQGGPLAPGAIKQGGQGGGQGGGQAQGGQGGGGGGGDKKCQKHPEKPECQGRN